jgi:hypothetical protein
MAARIRLRGADIEHDDIVRTQAMDQLLHTNRIELVAVAEEVACDLLDLGQAGLGYVPQGLQEPEDPPVGEGVKDVVAFLAGLDEPGTLQDL